MLNHARLLFCLLFGVFLVSNAWSWNSVGHRLVAKIACNHMNAQTKGLYNKYNRALGNKTLVNAAPWLDSQRNPDDLLMHYIDIPFSRDGSALEQPDKINAVTAIEKASLVLKDLRASLYDKGFSLRILLHVVGDIHQPMHAVSQYSRKHPHGDKGGNLVHLQNKSNLHSWWDSGGGSLKTKNKYSNAQLSRKARAIERRYPCNTELMTLNPEIWAKESHKIAVNQAYKIQSSKKPAKAYQQMTKKVSEERIALAGCRLAALLNNLA